MMLANLKIRLFILFIFTVVANSSAIGQKNALALKVVALGNEARTQPAKFLKTHEAELQEHHTQLYELLKKAKPIDAMIWDSGLEAQCNSKLTKGQLDPPYNGKNDLCGAAAGMLGSTSAPSPMDILSDFCTNLLDPNCKYFGMAFNSSNTTYHYAWGYRCDRIKMPFSYKGGVDSSKVDFAKLATAKSCTYMSPEERRMILEINLARAYPKVYAQIISTYLDEKANGSFGLDYDDYMAGLELLDELKSTEPMSILKPMPCVYEAAKKHGIDCDTRGFLDHTGSDGSAPWDRILGKCKELSQGNENLQGGGSSNPRDAVISLLIDGGISNRGHRYNMLDRSWVYVGCYHFLKKNPKMFTPHNWVQNFAR